VLAGVLLTGLAPLLLGWQAVVIQSGSMRPRIDLGDLVLVQPIDPRALRPGQVVLVDDPARPGALITHRVTDKDPQGRLLLRGDANPTADSAPVDPTGVHGIARLLVPWIGLPRLWPSHRDWVPLAGWLAGTSLAVAIAGVDSVRARERRSRRRSERAARAVAVALVVVAMGVGVARTGQTAAVFAAATRNPGNAFTAAAVFSTPYRDAVLADSPYLFWRLNETTGTSAADASGNSRAGAETNVTVGVTDALASENGFAVSVAGDGQIASPSVAAASFPLAASLEAWVKTTTTAGGMVLGRASVQSGNGGNTGHVLYLTNSGTVVFGVNGTLGKTVATSPLAYNDGAWHHLVGTVSAIAIVLYIDGVQVASTTGSFLSVSGNTFWRAGNANLNGWPSRPTNDALTGSIDEVAVYSSTLSAGRVAAHRSAAT
jgi:signal peptidase I